MSIVVPASKYSVPLWLVTLSLAENQQCLYNKAGTCHYKNGVDVTRLKNALQATVNTNYNLRSNFEEKQGILHQIINDHVDVILERYTAENEDKAKAIIQQKTKRPFNLSQEPLFRFALIENKYDQSMTLLGVFHHIIIDGTQYKKLMNIIERNYVFKPDLNKTDKDEVKFLKEYLQWEKDKISKVNLNYWFEKLKGYSLKCNLPYQTAAIDKQKLHGISKLYELDNSLYQKLIKFSKESGHSVFNILKTVYAILVSLYSNQDKVVIAYPFNVRRKQFKELKGSFVNTIFFPFERKGEFIEHLNRQKNDLFAMKNWYVDTVDQFAKLGKYNVSIAQRELELHNFEIKQNADNFVNITEIGELSFLYEDKDQNLRYVLFTLDKLFHEGFLDQFERHFNNLLETLLENPYANLETIACLDEAEHQKIIYEWNETKQDYPKDKTLVQLFEMQAKKFPNATAVVYEDQKLTYDELNRKSNQLARYIQRSYIELTKQPLQPNTLIAICVERSLEVIIGILGILKAGGAYVPISPKDPPERINYILEDTKTKLVLTQRNLLNLIARNDKTSLALIFLDAAEFNNETESDLISNNSSDNLGYVIYTSGTTGKPKGVMVTHHNLNNLVNHFHNKFQLNSKDRIAQYCSFSFDTFCQDWATSLLIGASLYIVPEKYRTEMHLLLQWLSINQITFIDLPTAVFHLLPEAGLEQLDHLHTLIVGGEKLERHSQPHWPFKLINAYGPTETTVECLTAEIASGKDSTMIIGKPLANTKIYILDSQLMPVPIGIPGELYISGAGLAQGYLNQPELTAQQFIPNPFETKPDQPNIYSRCYKTGDLARWLPNANIEYLGRSDYQVKLRGHRIELAEIENTLNTYPEVRQSVVLIKKQEKGKYLVCYYLAAQEIQSQQLRHYLLEKLPEYMVPNIYVHLEIFPLTINGKLNRNALPEPTLILEHNYIAPKNEVEHKLGAIWENILNIKPISINTDFFQIGGDSILSIQLVSQLHQDGFTIGVKDIFECRTIERLALHIKKGHAHIISAEQGQLSGAFPLLPIQAWFFAQKFDNPNHFNQSFLVTVPPLNLKKLQQVIEQIAAYHDALRLRFEFKNDAFLQNYHVDIHCPKLEIANITRFSKQDINELLTEWQSEFDITQGPLWKVGYLEGYADGSARLYFALHHLIIDSVSWRILINSIKTLYENKNLNQKTSSYRQWVQAIHAYPQTHSDELSYWRNICQNAIPDYSNCDAIHTTISEIKFSKTITNALLQKANAAYHTEINDLLLTALALALKTHHYQDESYITLEGHGRETIAEALDVSHTVGWFTTIFPVKLSVKGEIGKSIQSIKETLRAIPNKGIGYSIFKYIAREDSLKNYELPPISFNYLGQFDNQESYWQLSSDAAGREVDPKNNDGIQLYFQGLILEGELRFMIVSRLSKADTDAIVTLFQKSLENVIHHCLDQITKGEIYYTPSDFNPAHISQKLLDHLQNKYAIEAISPANNLQPGLIYHALSQPNDDAYRVQLLLDFHNKLDLVKFKQAWKLVIQYYPALRIAFNWEEELLQIVTKTGVLHWFEHDITFDKDPVGMINTIREKDQKQIFDLTQPSLLRIHIIKQHEEHYTLLLTSHHSILDGWSNSILLDKVYSFYKQILQNESIITVYDPTYLEAQRYITKHKSIAESYWKNKINTALKINDLNCMLSSFADLNKVKAIKDPKNKTIEVPHDLYQRLRNFARNEGITLNVILQFAWHKLIQVYTHDDQTIVGTTVSGRNIPVAGVENDVGLYINTLPLIIDWQHRTVREQLKYIHHEITELTNQSHVCLSNLQHEGKRLFHSLFIYENFPIRTQNIFDLNIQFRGVIHKLDYPLGMIIYEQDRLILDLHYAGEYLTELDATRRLDQMLIILEQIANKAEEFEKNISLLSATEYATIIHKWNATGKEYLCPQTLYQLFEAQVDKMPDSIAVVLEDKRLSYRELNSKANQLARLINKHYEIKIGILLQPDTLIGICIERSLEMIIGILAILKTGAAYVPIDPSYPVERIKYLLADAQIKLVLSQNSLKMLFPTGKTTVFFVDKKEYEYEQTQNLPPLSLANHLAYVMYTSGTTGKPKGVMIEHASICNNVHALKSFYTINQQIKKVAAYATFVFDVSIMEIFATLLQGGELHILSDLVRKDLTQLSHYILTHKINYLYLPPAVLTIFPKVHYPDLKKILITGDICEQATGQYWAEQCQLYNYYGPTETIFTTGTAIKAGVNVNIIGKPLENTRLYVLDPSLQPVPIGVIGELYVGGTGLARGYLNKPELTAERFIKNPFATESDQYKNQVRLYKTGDFVRWLPDGNVEFIARNDFQVKLHGFRIELGEIESALNNHPYIQQSVVIFKQQTGNSHLVAYYRSLVPLDSAEVKQHLLNHLPSYMIPEIYIAVPEFPLTLNGKLDRKALPEPGNTIAVDYTAPRNDLERNLCNLWEEALNVKPIGISDDFFRIGGNSIRAIQLVAKMQADLNFTIKISELYTLKTIESIIKHNYQPILEMNQFNHQKKKLFMIHPGFSGCEVYSDLARKLSDKYHCFGIDNYNMHQAEKITTLNKIALVYRDYIKSKIKFDNDIYLLGWSLGGQIALEIAAILENEGAQNITVYLLDTFLPDTQLNKFANTLDKHSYLKEIESRLRALRYEDYYINNVLSAAIPELLIRQKVLSKQLQTTRVILFKALNVEQEGSFENNLTSYCITLVDNNLSPYCKNLTVIPINSNHYNILVSGGLTSYIL